MAQSIFDILVGVKAYLKPRVLSLVGYFLQLVVFITKVLLNSVYVYLINVIPIGVYNKINSIFFFRNVVAISCNPKLVAAIFTPAQGLRSLGGNPFLRAGAYMYMYVRGHTKA
jgi:hypothetical protein